MHSVIAELGRTEVQGAFSMWLLQAHSICQGPGTDNRADSATAAGPDDQQPGKPVWT